MAADPILVRRLGPLAVRAKPFETHLKDLGTICVNTIEPTDRSIPPFKKVTLPTALQRPAFQLPGVSHQLGYTA